MKTQNFLNFKEEIQTKNRTFLSKESLEFLDWLSNNSEEFTQLLSKDHQLFRARVWPNGSCLLKPDDMKPVPEYSSDGRANPYGINMLYLADHPEIAAAEVRPNKNEKITVAKFVTTRELKIMDFAKERNGWNHWFKNNSNTDPEAYHKKDIFLAIGEAFSAPISVRDSKKEYAPTQTLAEYFKSLGFDGISYQSQFLPSTKPSDQVKTHKNYTLFDLNSADPKSFEVFSVQQQYVELKKEQLSQSY